jgi:hypothetical protein
MGLFEESGAIANGTREGAARIPKELAFQQFDRDGRAVYRDHALRRPWAQRMNGASDTLLPRSGLPENERGCIADGDTLHLGAQLLHGRGAAEQTWQRLERTPHFLHRAGVSG